MRPWDIYLFAFKEEGAHPAVIISNEERCDLFAREIGFQRNARTGSPSSSKVNRKKNGRVFASSALNPDRRSTNSQHAP